MSLFSNDLSKEPIFDGIGYEPSFFSRKTMVTTKTNYSKKSTGISIRTPEKRFLCSAQKNGI